MRKFIWLSLLLVAGCAQLGATDNMENTEAVGAESVEPLEFNGATFTVKVPGNLKNISQIFKPRIMCGLKTLREVGFAGREGFWPSSFLWFTEIPLQGRNSSECVDTIKKELIRQGGLSHVLNEEEITIGGVPALKMAFRYGEGACTYREIALIVIANDICYLITFYGFPLETGPEEAASLVVNSWKF